MCSVKWEPLHGISSVMVILSKQQLNPQLGCGILSKYSTKIFTSRQRNPTTILFFFPRQKKAFDSLNMGYSASNQESFKAISDEY